MTSIVFGLKIGFYIPLQMTCNPVKNFLTLAVTLFDRRLLVNLLLGDDVFSHVMNGKRVI